MKTRPMVWKVVYAVLVFAVTIVETCIAQVSSAPSGAMVYLHTDLTGNVVMATDASGQKIWEERFLPFGVKRLNASGGVGSTTSSSQLFGFHGASRDPETGLLYMGARFYDPLTGRFAGFDPVAARAEDIASFNRYAYGNNNPYGFTDPDGRTPIDLAFLAYDVYNLVQAVRSGEGIGGASIDVAISALGVISPVPGLGEAYKAGRTAERVVEGTLEIAHSTKEATTVIGRVKDLKSLEAGEKSLLDRLPNIGGPKTNWKQNAGALREEMGRGLPIRDASPGDTAGQFLNAERNLLRDRGWTFDSKTNFWMPPKP